MSNLPFPQKVLDQHAFVTGKTGAGKSSAMRLVAEHLLDHKKRLVVIDPKGDWFGLQFSADGKSAGYPVITFGDFKGDNYKADVPINEHSGQHVAELLTSGNRPAVIGLRGWFTAHMTKFWIDFAKHLFHSNEGELYLMIDEAQNFAPKGSLSGLEGAAGTGLHWTNRLLAEGRGLGINIWVGSQRPQKVHNDTLDGCETLIAMRTVHPAARDALVKWMKGTGDKKATETILTNLAEMPRGDAWVWSPEIGFGPKRVTFPMFQTFDSFAPPQLQKKVERQTWANVDLDEVKEKLASVIKEAEANDPKALRTKIVQLERELREKRTYPETKTETKIEKVEVPILKDNEVVDLQAAANSARMAAQELTRETDRIEKLLEKAQEIVRAGSSVGRAGAGLPVTRHERPVAGSNPAPRNISRPQMAAGAVKPPNRALLTASTSADGELTPKRRGILNALATFESLGIMLPTREQVAGFTVTPHTSGGYKNNLGALRSAGFIDYPTPGTIRLTSSGKAHSQADFTFTNSGELHQIWLNKLSPARARILGILIERYPGQITREALADGVDAPATSGGFKNNLGALRTLGLIDYPNPGMVAATETLFPPGL